MTENNNKPKSGVNLKIFFIKLISISVAIIIIINFLFNIILAERLEKIDKILSVSESTKRYELKEKIRDEINQGLDKKNMLHVYCWQSSILVMPQLKVSMRNSGQLL